MSDEARSDGHDLLEAAYRSATRLMAGATAPVRRVRLQAGEVTVEVEWPELPGAEPVVGAAPGVQPAEAPAGEAVAEDLHYLRATTVGTFYRAHEPGASPFVSEGDIVDKGQQVGILEAMKMMMPVEADRTGVVVRILAENGASVEYDQPIIALRCGEPL